MHSNLPWELSVSIEIKVHEVENVVLEISSISKTVSKASYKYFVFHRKRMQYILLKMYASLRIEIAQNITNYLLLFIMEMLC